MSSSQRPMLNELTVPSSSPAMKKKNRTAKLSKTKQVQNNFIPQSHQVSKGRANGKAGALTRRPAQVLLCQERRDRPSRQDAGGAFFAGFIAITGTRPTANSPPASSA